MSQKQQSLPYRKRFFRLLTKLVLITVFIVCLLLLGLNFWLPNHIDNYRSDLEALLSSKIHAPVSISRLSAQRDGLLPCIEISDLRIKSPDGTDGLHIETISATPSFASLLLLKIQFADLTIEKPEVHIDRRDNNTFWVAGIDISTFAKNTPDPQKTAEEQKIPTAVLWLIRQPRITLNSGLVQWSDQKNSATPVQLRDINASLRSSGHTHNIILEATPPKHIAEQFTIQTTLTEPVLNTATRFQNWEMQTHSAFSHIDIQNLYHHFPLPVKNIQGDGFIETSAHYKDGQLIDSKLKLHIPELEIIARAGLPPITFSDFSSTFKTTWNDNTLHIQSDDLSFRHLLRTTGQDSSEKTWTNKHIDLAWQFDEAYQLCGGLLKIVDIDLETLSYVALGLPLPEGAQQALSEMNTQGNIDFLNIQWQGPISEPKTYALQGRLSDLKTIAGKAPPIPPEKKIAMGRPGIEHLNISFDLNQNQGELQLSLEDGSVNLPGLFDQPHLPIKNLQATAYLQRLENGQIKIDAPQIQLITEDFELDAHLGWNSPNPNDVEDTAGYFTMQGKLLNGQVTSVARYLPNSIQPKVRTYLKAALISGEIPQASVTIHGPLADFPYHHKNTGVFLIKGKAHNATYDFAPSVIHPTPQAAWPVLDQVSGDMEITGSGMIIHNAAGTIINTPGSRFSAQEISIPNWSVKDTHVLISANIQGPANALLKTVNQSPIGQTLLKDLLTFARISGDIATDLQLDIMLDRMPESTVQGQIHLNNNTMSLWPFLPVLQKAKANLSFTEKGFSATQIRAQSLGGNVQGEVHLDLKKGLRVDLKGTFTSKGLFADANWGHQLLPDLKWLDGQSTYTFTAAHEGEQQIMRWESDLQGMEVLLPDPMRKAAQTPFPLKITLTPVQSGVNQFLPLLIKIQTPQQSDLPRFQAQYVLNKNNDGVKITQGTIGINQTPIMPITGTTAYVQLDRLNVPNWQSFLQTIPNSPSAANDTARLSSSNLVLPVWWPQTTTANIGELRIGERFVTHDTQLFIQRQYDDWGAQITSKEIEGHLRWQARKSSSPSLLSANFSRLWLPSFMSGEEKQQAATHQNTQAQLFTLLPNTQLTVDDLRFGDKKLGSVNMQAQIDRTVTPSRWRIQRLEIINEAATLTAQGYWANTLIPTTALDIRVDLNNTGQLIAELGYEKVLAAAPGKITGVLRWQAIPYAFDIRSLSGNLDIELGKGQVLFADPGAGRLLSVLSLQAIPRRLSLDFRDLFHEGLAFDSLKGQLIFNHGQLDVGQINLAGASAQVHVNGTINLIDETQQLQVIILPLFDAIPVSIALAAVNPPVGIGSLLAQLALKKPLQDASVRIYDVHGSWETPEVTLKADQPATQTQPIQTAP